MYSKAYNFLPLFGFSFIFSLLGELPSVCLKSFNVLIFTLLMLLAVYFCVMLFFFFLNKLGEVDGEIGMLCSFNIPM